MTVETFVVEQPWIDNTGRLRLERRQTDTFEDGSFTVTVANEMPVGATTLTRQEYDAQMAAVQLNLDAAMSTTDAIQGGSVAPPSVDDVRLSVSIQDKLVGLGFTSEEAQAIFP